MLYLKKSDYEIILNHCQDNLPNEACGLIAGRIKAEDKVIEKIYLMTNLDQSHEHFSMDPKEQLAAIKDMRTHDYLPLGNFHSHPNTPSRPSEEDKRLAFDPSTDYLILSLMDKNKPVLKAFLIDKAKNITEELITII
ncbi:M67 family metallopeptidase [Acetobacterium sp. UBA5834]|jgi:proteasome lid subunit RPN8/RPN11|uniref:M67 family metallopeptidase n=1 Tax=Acetobacterium sp. UBA5834 TaxID=1945907 RepID=UPI0025795E52|nr:M67 family metallopeptidase [Acetobacterium sp. UBA5834]